MREAASSPHSAEQPEEEPKSASALGEAKALVRLAAPLALANLGQVLLGVVDTAVLGRLGASELGGAGLGNSLYFAITTLGLGVMMGLDALIAQAHGAGEARRARRTLWQGLWLAGLFAVPLISLILLIASLLPHAGVPREVAAQAQTYIYARCLGVVPFLMFAALRSYLQSVGRPSPMLFASLLVNLLNLPLTWFLVFGDAGFARLGFNDVALGIPALGVAGAGATSVFCAAVQVAVLTWFVRRVPVPGGERSLRRPEPALMRRAVRLGLPVGFTLLAEVGIFALTNVAMGNLGQTAIAAHQVAMILASGTFMVPLGIGAAASVRVGAAIGRGDALGVRRAGGAAVAAGVCFMSLAALAFLLVPEPIARLITDQPEVLGVAVPLLFVAAVFQVFDGAQTVLAGALRGAGDTRVTLAWNLGGYYLIGAPIGLWLAFQRGWGAQGLWWGLSAGLVCVAVGLAYRFHRVSHRPLARV